MLYGFSLWAGLIFFGAAECEIPCSFTTRRVTSINAVAMILRVWALYGGSKVILGALLTLYATEIIPYLTFSIKFSSQNEIVGA